MSSVAVSKLGVRETRANEARRAVKTESVSIWRRFFRMVRTSFEASFDSDWEKNTGLHWREWGKL